MKSHELRQWRERNGYSQGRLARILEVDVMTVSRWERGIMRIPSFLKLALAYIELKGDESKPVSKLNANDKKGGNEDGGTSGVPSLPQKAKRKI